MKTRYAVSILVIILLGPCLSCGGGGTRTSASTSTPLVFASSGGSTPGSNVVSTYRVETSGQLATVGSRATGGVGTSRLTFDPVRNLLFAPNSASNSVTVFQVDRQTAVLTQATSAPAATTASPEEVVLHPTFAVVYVLNTTGQIDVFSIGVGGLLTRMLPTLTNPFPQIHNAAISADGRFLFVVSGGPGVNGQVTTYAIDSATGALTGLVNANQPTAGVNTRSMLLTNISGSAAQFLYMTNTDSGSISAFQVDAATGALQSVAGSPFVAGSQVGPLAVVGNFLFVVERGSSNLRRFVINGDGSVTLQTLTTLNATPVGDDLPLLRSQNLLFLGGGTGSTPAVLQVTPATGVTQHLFGPAAAQAGSVGLATAEAP